MSIRTLFPPFLLLLGGCSTLTPSLSHHVSGIAGEVHGTGSLAMLSWIGGVATLAGIAALVVTSGRMGLRAVIAGVCLVILNFVIANYLSWILIPVLVATGCVSLGWAYVTVRKLMNKDRCSG